MRVMASIGPVPIRRGALAAVCAAALLTATAAPAGAQSSTATTGPGSGQTVTAQTPT
ncbi:MAG: hypothetical protein QOG70_3085, partial [Solirubrobacteraceae bacterium]|nr:hypothetical protein [Solirubrobacteraceae bacterium]